MKLANEKTMKIDMSSSEAFIDDVTRRFTNSYAYYREHIGIENMWKYKTIYDAAMDYETENWKNRGFKPMYVRNGKWPNTVEVIMEKIGAAKYCLTHLPRCKHCGKEPSVHFFDLETGYKTAPTGWISCECGDVECNNWADAVFFYLYKHVDKQNNED